MNPLDPFFTAKAKVRMKRTVRYWPKFGKKKVKLAKAGTIKAT